MKEEDVSELAEELAKRVIINIREQKHEFWIDPENHYRAHLRMDSLSSDDYNDLHELAKMFRTSRNLFWKAFIGLAILGLFVLTAIGLNNK